MITCTFENGKKTSLRHITVNSIIVNADNKILLVKRSPSVINGNKYGLIGGFLDRDETTRQAAIREAEEETGLHIAIEYLLRIVDGPNRPKEDRQNVDFVYVAKVVGGEPRESSEGSIAGWFSEENLPSEKEFAFDHRESIKVYFSYSKQKFSIPVIGSI